jgi:hypothetical protein
MAIDRAVMFTGGPSNTSNVSAPYTFPTDQFSITFWYKTSTVLANNAGLFDQEGSVVLYKQGSNDIQMYAYLNASADFAGLRRLRIGRGLSVLTTDGKWHNRAYVIYVNGTNHGAVDEYEDAALLVSSATDYTGDTTTPTGNFLIGRGAANGGSLCFDGTIDQMMIFNTKLTLSQIQYIYNNYGPPGGLNTGARWEFSEGIGTTVADSSGNGNNGSFGGSPLPLWVDGVKASPPMFLTVPSINIVSQTKIVGY